MTLQWSLVRIEISMGSELLLVYLHTTVPDNKLWLKIKVFIPAIYHTSKKLFLKAIDLIWSDIQQELILLFAGHWLVGYLTKELQEYIPKLINIPHLTREKKTTTRIEVSVLLADFY